VAPALAAAIDIVTAAVGTAERLRVEYWTASRDEVTQRVITPRRVFNDRGEWYVAADDGRSGERRTFRIDRLESIERTGEHATIEPVTDGGPTPDWFADAGLRRVTLRLAPAARWVVERYPVDTVKARRGGGVDATFPVASERWLERLLVRLGADAEVRAPAEWRRLGADVAVRVLARYAEAGTGE
jgi:proteasome accessory factor C